MDRGCRRRRLRASPILDGSAARAKAVRLGNWGERAQLAEDALPAWRRVLRDPSRTGKDPARIPSNASQDLVELDGSIWTRPDSERGRTRTGLGCSDWRS